MSLSTSVLPKNLLMQGAACSSQHLELLGYEPIGTFNMYSCFKEIQASSEVGVNDKSPGILCPPFDL